MKRGSMHCSIAWLFAALLAGPAAAGEDLDRLLTEISGRASANVVAVEAVRAWPGKGVSARGRCMGTGVLLADGYVATTLSVAGPGDEITLRFGDGRTSPASVVAVSPLRELVLLQPAERRGPGLPYGHADSLHAGSWVFVVGYSMNSPEPMPAIGRFSSRSILTLNDSSPDTIELLQLEANVFPGNSGAAVIDSEGRFVGIILGGLGRDGFLDPVVLSTFDEELPLTQCIMTAQPPLGIGFSLPASDVRALAASVRDGTLDGTAYLGIRVAVVDPDAAEDERGVRVSEVVAGSPAAVAGVRSGDVIHAINGTPIDDPMTLVTRVRELRPGATADLALGAPAGEADRHARVVLGDYTIDYRMPLVWHRLLSGRASSLTDAKERLVESMGVVDSELRKLEMLSSGDAGGRSAAPRLVNGE